MPPLVGYARVSSVGQSLSVQLDHLKKAGCDKIFQEKRSGLDGKRRQLRECLRYLREGDTLVITRLDRLARSSLHLAQILADLEQKGVDFKVLDRSGIDTTTPQGKLLFTIMAGVAEFETQLRKERQQEGIARAKAEGVEFGRPRKLTPKQIEELRWKRDQGATIAQLCDEYDLARSGVYRMLED